MKTYDAYLKNQYGITLLSTTVWANSQGEAEEKARRCFATNINDPGVYIVVIER